jgi:hypothetical protein
MGAGKGKSRRARASQVAVHDNYEAQRAWFTTKIEDACSSGDEEALEQVLEDIGEASKADLQYLEQNATDEDVIAAVLAWASLTNDAVQRFYMPGSEALTPSSAASVLKARMPPPNADGPAILEMFADLDKLSQVVITRRDADTVAVECPNGKRVVGKALDEYAKEINSLGPGEATPEELRQTQEEIVEARRYVDVGDLDEPLTLLVNNDAAEAIEAAKLYMST